MFTAPAESPPLAAFGSPRATVLLGVDGMVSPRNEHAIEASLAKLPGVKARASFASRSLRVEFDRTQCAMPEIVRRLDELGLRLRPGGPAPPHETTRQYLRRVTELAVAYHKIAMAAAGAVLLVAAVIIRAIDGPAPARYACLALSFVIAGWYTARDTFHVLRHFRFDIDVLMFAAAFGAAAIGHYEEGALLLVLFAFGGAGEELAMDRARRAIEGLATLAPDTATLRDASGNDRFVRVEDLKLDDRVVVRPFDRLPADGVVESGASAVDQSPITGESIPVEKVVGSNVYAGTINGEGLLIVTVRKLAGESTLAKVVNLVREAQTNKSPTQEFTDRVEHWYVPCVLVATALLIFVPPLLELNHRRVAAGMGMWSGWFYNAMAFLTAASPCALAIGTPAAVLCGIARAARIGVLVKGGVHLENLGRVRVVAFDKTGTLTQGRAQVTGILTMNSIHENDLLAQAAAAERVATHPLALAIVNEATARGCPKLEAIDARQVPGHGVRATIDGRSVSVGRLEMIAAPGPDLQRLLLAASESLGEGKSFVGVAIDGQPAGIISLADQPRPAARAAIARLRQMRIRHTIMLTGDKQSVADAVGRDVGIDEVRAELLPQEKLDLVHELERKYGPLAMIGDGINDAPALATATVGIAMGGAGSDVAIETADIALMSDDLARLPDAIGLSRFSRRVITQNLVIALGVITLLAPLAAMGFAYLGVAVMFHEGSTVVVVLNSLRLLVFRPRRVNAR